MSAIDDLLQVLTIVARAAEHREPLPAALRREGGPLGPDLAERLERGEDLRQALVGRLTAERLDLLADALPCLPARALLVAEDLRAERERRWAWADLLARPVVTLLIVGGYAALAAEGLAFHLSVAWSTIAGVLTVLVLVVVALAGRPGAHRRLPWLAGWAHHARAASRYSRAALVARWRVDDHQALAWLGADLQRLAPLLGRPDAESTCLRLAAWHRESSLRARRRLGSLLALLLILAAGALLLAAATPVAARLMSEIAAAQ